MVATVAMTVAHALFHLPAGLTGIAFYHAISSPAQYGPYIAPLFDLFICSNCVSSLGSLADAVIYFALFPAFRHGAKSLLLC